MANRFDFEGFKRDHYARLGAACDGVRRFHDNLPLGKHLTAEELTAFLLLIDALVAFRPLLPAMGGGQPAIDRILDKVPQLTSATADSSFWRAQEIATDAFTIHNYMAAMVDDAVGPYESKPH